MSGCKSIRALYYTLYYKHKFSENLEAFPGESLNKLIVSFIGNYIERKTSGKVLMNQMPLIKCIKLFHCQSFVLYSRPAAG